MATRKDLLDAFTFSRRRMLSNVLQPSATGTDESAPRPLRNFAGGITIAVILVLVFLLIGVFKGNGASASTNVLLLDKDTGGRYIVQNGRAYPVANVASAELILSSPMTVQTVSDSAITGLGKTVGPTVGIPGLPDYLPSSSDLDLTTWTACTVPAGTGVDTDLGVGFGALAPLTSRQALVVQDTGTQQYWVLDGGVKYQVDPNFGPGGGNAGKVLNSLNLLKMNKVFAKDDFLSVIPAGAMLTIPTVTSPGTPVPVSVGDGVFSKVGQYATVTSGTGASDDVIMTEQGAAVVNPFVYALYSVANPTGIVGNLTVGQYASMKHNTSNTPLNGIGGDWPTVVPTIVDGTDNADAGDFCATTGGGSQVTLSMANSLSFGSGGTSPDQPTAAEADTVYVKGGHGVIATATDGGAAGKAFLVTDTGLRYQLDSSLVTSADGSSSTSVTAQARLGYDKVKALSLPSAWIALIQEGPDMSPGNALCTEQVAGEAQACLTATGSTGSS